MFAICHSADVQQVSEQIVQPEEVNWFIVGDKSKIAANLDKLGFDQIIEIDADGNPVTPALQEKDEAMKS